MSMSFENKINDEQKRMLGELFGDKLKAIDGRTALLEGKLVQGEMKKVCNDLNQIVTVELNSEGDTKTIDGEEYTVTSEGWEKAPKDLHGELMR